jgi:CHASE2 domain-containing sensor protein
MSEEGEEAEFELEEAQPRAVMFDVPEGQIMVPDLDALAEALGDAPLALWAHEKGLLWLTPKRRWEPVDVDSGPKVASIRKN